MNLFSRLSKLFLISRHEVLYPSSDSVEFNFVGPYESYEQIARFGIQHDQILLTWRDDLPRYIFEILAASVDLDVLSGVAMNLMVPPDILDRIAACYPELHELCAMNSNASPELKMTLQLSKHVELSLERFLDDVNASEKERMELFAASRRLFEGPKWELGRLLRRLKLMRHYSPPKSPPLGEVWRQIRG